MNHKLFLDRMKDREYEETPEDQKENLLKKLQEEIVNSFHENPTIFDKIHLRPVGLWNKNILIVHK